MNNKDYIGRLSTKLGIDAKEAQLLTNLFVNALADKLDEGGVMSVQGFGNFEVKKKMERVVVNPTTKQRMLVPPKLALAFRPSPVLKEKMK